MATPFENFVNTELPKRISTDEDPLMVPAGMVPVTTGTGLQTTFQPYGGGGGGSSEIESKTIFVDFSTTSVTATTLANTNVLTDVVIYVTEAWNGPTASVTIGTDGDQTQFVGTDEIDLTTVGQYNIGVGYVATSSTTVKVFVSSGPGGTQGSAYIVVNKGI